MKARVGRSVALKPVWEKEGRAMLQLIDTIIGFSAIMLALSFLVKSLTSVVKNHFDYYSENLKSELNRFLSGIPECKANDCSAMGAIRWKRLGEEFLSMENMAVWLEKLGMNPETIEKQKKALEARLKVHKENIRYVFAKRTNNIALALGLALCLFLNINAICIWQTLYTDEQLRGEFASSYAAKVTELAGQSGSEGSPGNATEDGSQNPSEPVTSTTNSSEQDRDALAQQRENFREDLGEFLADVNFGVGHIWGKAPAEGERQFLLLEFLGSLLTGVLVSIGAPYWHDILGALAGLRKKA